MNTIKMDSYGKVIILDGETPAEFFKAKAIDYSKMVSINESNQTAEVYGFIGYCHPSYNPDGYLQSKGWGVIEKIPMTGHCLFKLEKI